MSRPPTQPLGRAGEDAAVRFLERRGFQIVARNVRSRLGEIDLVARDGPTLVFVEVKARRHTDSMPPQLGVNGRKRMRLTRLAHAFLARQWRANQSCRFDVVAVVLGEEGREPLIDHFPGAFAADGWIL
jgi:putative endonuclease